MPNARFDHVDIVVTSLERSLEFYRGLLGPLGWIEASEITGERGETVIYLSPSDRGASALGLRERQNGDPTPYDRYAVGLHHLCFTAPSREAVDNEHDG